jgi:ABC-2 type transport system permease protein
MLLSIFLSGFMFPRETMPLWAYVASHFVPATYMIQIARGVILRDAGLAQLWFNGLVLFAPWALACCCWRPGVSRT